MTVNFSSDGETDRMLSLRASSRIPLPPEIALCDPRDAREYFGWMTYYEVFGVSDHPFVKLLSKRRLDAAMAAAVSRAPHLDRVSHYSAWIGNRTVRIVPPAPTQDDPDRDGERRRSQAAVPSIRPRHTHTAPLPHGSRRASAAKLVGVNKGRRGRRASGTAPTAVLPIS